MRQARNWHEHWIVIAVGICTTAWIASVCIAIANGHGTGAPGADLETAQASVGQTSVGQNSGATPDLTTNRTGNPRDREAPWAGTTRR